MSAARRIAATLENRLQRTPTPALASLPALAAAIRRSDRRADLPTPWAALVRYDPLVPMYRIPPGTPDSEAAVAAQVLLAIADRLRRLTTAYAQWQQFDAPAFFDLSVEQTARLVRIVERVTSVNVTIYMDQLLPSFAAAASLWQLEFRPAYWETHSRLMGESEPPVVRTPLPECNAALIAAWTRAVAGITLARRLLDDEIGFWAANGAGEERNRYRAAWQTDPAPGLDPALLTTLDQAPTLTLAVDFSLPAARQPGRLRRLHRLQLRRRAGRLRARSA